MLPALKFNCKRLMLIGDPQQLPPIVRKAHGLKFCTKTDFSHTAEKSAANCSVPRKDPRGIETALFVRLQEVGYAPTFMTTQFRCHPQIATLCSDLFYNSRLCSGISASDRLVSSALIVDRSLYLCCLYFFIH